MAIVIVLVLNVNKTNNFNVLMVKLSLPKANAYWTNLNKQ